MKKYIIIGLAIAFIAACEEKKAGTLYPGIPANKYR